MGANLPGWLGYVVGATIFILAGIILGAIAVYAWLEDRRQRERDRNDQRNDHR